MAKKNIVSETAPTRPSRRIRRPELLRNIVATLADLGYRGEQVRKGRRVVERWVQKYDGRRITFRV